MATRGLPDAHVVLDDGVPGDSVHRSEADEEQKCLPTDVAPGAL